MPKCGSCGGEGRVTWEEDGRAVEDACYRCGMTGVVSEETVLDARIEVVAERLAVSEVERIEATPDPEGEGLGLAAAESGMSLYDYKRQMVWGITDRIGRELAKLSRSTLLSLLDTLDPAPAPAPPAPVVRYMTRVADAEVVRLIAADAADDDELPF